MLSAFKRSAVSFAALAAFFVADARADGWSIDLSKRSIGVSIFGGNHRHQTSRGYRRYSPPRQRYAPQKVWVPGCYITEYEKSWVQGSHRKVYVQPVFEKRYDACGNPYRFKVSPGYYEVVHEPGYWETRPVKVWKSGYWRVIHGRGH